MLRPLRWPLTLLALVLPAWPAAAQLPELLEDRPPLHVPLQPWTAQDQQKREALMCFARGVLCERGDRLLEAISHYEESLKLDPGAVPVLKALLVLYIAVDRQDEALALARQVLQTDPHDYQTCYLGARLLRGRDQPREAGDLLREGLKSPRVGERPDVHQQMEYDLGVLYERQQRYEEAAAAFGRAAELLDRPDELLESRLSTEELRLRSAESHERAGRNLLEARQFDGAVAAFRRAQECHPAGGGRLNLNIAQVRLQQGQLADALAALDGYLALMPQGTEAYDLKIAVLQKLRRDAEIVPWLEKASAQDRFNISLKLLLGRHYATAGDVAKAEGLYRDLADMSPSEELYRDLFQLYLRHHSGGAGTCIQILNAAIAEAAPRDNGGPGGHPPSRASRAMIGALRENPDLTNELVKAGTALLAGPPLHVETLHLFAVLAERHGLETEAELYYRACLRQEVPAALEPTAYGGLLRLLGKSRRYEAIVEVCRQGLKQVRENNRVLLRSDLARGLAQLGKHDEALAEADTALREAREAEKFAIRLLRVRLLLQAERLDQAEAECQALLKEFTLPGEALEIHYLLSNVYNLARRLPQAEAELEACLKLDPNNATINNDLGFLWADQNKNLAEAEAMIRKAIDLDRKNRQGALVLGPGAEKEQHDNACFIDSLGWVLFRRGQVEAARKELEDAVALPDGDDPAIWDHLGDIYEALGQLERAGQAWAKALDFYDQGKRHKMEERYRVLQEKLRRVPAGR
jgi:tetratricopeptide (TPR) repeat protein